MKKLFNIKLLTLLLFIIGCSSKKTDNYISLYDNGNKRFERIFTMIRGTETSWYENGQKAGESEYRDGEQHGSFTTWHKNGRKSGEGSYRDGRVATSSCWNEDGQEEPCPY